MNENSMAQIPTEGQPAFPVETTENDNSADSPTVEETNTEQTPSSEENNEQTPEENAGETPKEEPLDKNPRWKERENDWKERFNDQETRHTNDLKSMREEFEEKYGKPSKGETPATIQVPDWFGGDETQFAAFSEHLKTLTKSAKEEAIAEIKEKGDAEQGAIQEATDYMNTEVSSIETDEALNPDKVKIDRNKLLKFTMDNKLVDTEGKWNYRAAFQLMQAGVKSAKSETIKEKKGIASVTTGGGAPTEKPAHATSEDFEDPSNRPW